MVRDIPAVALVVAGGVLCPDPPGLAADLIALAPRSGPVATCIPSLWPQRVIIIHVMPASWRSGIAELMAPPGYRRPQVFLGHVQTTSEDE